MKEGMDARLVQQQGGLSVSFSSQATQQKFAKELESLQAAVADKDTQGSSLQKQIKLLKVLSHKLLAADRSLVAARKGLTPASSWLRRKQRS